MLRPPRGNASRKTHPKNGDTIAVDRTQNQPERRKPTQQHRCRSLCHLIHFPLYFPPGSFVVHHHGDVLVSINRQPQRDPPCEEKSRRKSGASPAPSTPNAKTIEEDAKKYVDHGLPSVPKNPKDGRTVPYETAICRIRAKEYGEEILDQFNEKDRDGSKRIVYLAGRNFGRDTSWNLETRNAKMLKLVGGQDENTTKRFDLMLSHPADRDLLHQTIGAEDNEDCYVNSGQATGKTYEQSYGEQIVAIL